MKYPRERTLSHRNALHCEASRRDVSQRLMIDPLEPRTLMAWSGYAQLVSQDDAASHYPTVTGKGVTVAVIDTGIDYTKVSLGGGFGKNYKVIGGYDFHQNDADPMDTSGHGTQVASVIAANAFTTGGVTYQGVAPDAKLVALRVGTESNITDSNIERALQWVITNYKTYNISIVNMSLGSGAYADSRTEAQLSDELKTLRDLGIFVVAASGNSNDSQSGPISQDGIAFPAADTNVFAVGAVDSTDLITDWAQRGDELDLLAPGEDIVAPTLAGGFDTVDGTSFSSPYVAGTAALIKQVNPRAVAGDMGSILMSSGASNRDGDPESGNTTTLLFSRLNIDAAVRAAGVRVGRTSTLPMGRTIDTAMDSQGVLHAAFYDTTKGRLLYATRSIAGLWSLAQIVDASADVGVQASIAVDNSGKVGIGYFDVTNTAVKYASNNGSIWSNVTIDADKHVGTFPSLGFDIDGNAYLAYYRRSGGMLRMATLDRDANTWSRITVDDSADVGAFASLDVGEAAIRSGPFTTYDTTVAIAYADNTNGDLKYARIDLDDANAEWFMSTVADTGGVSNISFDLHNGPLNLGLQAQIAYVDTAAREVRYAYKNTDWFIESVGSVGVVGGSVEMAFDADDDPIIAFYHGEKRIVYSGLRTATGSWTLTRLGAGSGVVAIGENDRNDTVLISWLNRARSELGTIVL